MEGDGHPMRGPTHSAVATKLWTPAYGSSRRLTMLSNGKSKGDRDEPGGGGMGESVYDRLTGCLVLKQYIGEVRQREIVPTEPAAQTLVRAAETPMMKINPRII
jgi:hypothetical protein